jgi:excisionase family DNA binding protein
MRYLTATQAGKVIGVTDRTIRDWIKEGKLTAHHPAKNRLAIPEHEVQALARERKQYQVEIPDIVEIAHDESQLNSTIGDN